MADLDFSHSVQQIPAQEELPKPYQRQVSAQSVSVPDYQSAMTNYAESTNWMSKLGATIAAKSSNALASKLGGELGKNPQGDIGIPLTDFDKTMQESYQTQASATLGVQAHQLITDSNVAMSQATRITPDLIAKTNKSISIGLQNIFKNAPQEIRPHLEQQYQSLQISQSADLSKRMDRESKEDMRNNADYASDINAENAYAFYVKGDYKAGQAAVESTRRQQQSLVDSKLKSPEAAKVKIDAAEKSGLQGKLVHEYENSSSKEEYLKKVAEGAKDYKSQEAAQGLLSYVAQQHALKKENEQLLLAKHAVDLYKNPLQAANQLADLKEYLSPIEFQKATLASLKAVDAYKKEQGNIQEASAYWSDSEKFSHLEPKILNKTFDLLTQKTQEKNPGMSHEEAQVMVAASAGGKIPLFQKILENELTSGNPANIEKATRQMQLLDDMEARRVYSDVSPKAKAIAYQFQNQRGSMPDSDLARKITDNLSNIDEPMQKALDNAWNLKLSAKGAGGLGANKSLGDFALKEVGLTNKESFGGDYFRTIYGNDIYNQLNSNFVTTRGDYATAVQMTKDYVKEHYGETTVNGSKQISDNTIEKYLGFEGHDIIPDVHQDLLNALSISFAKAKENHPNDYWTTLPLKGNTAEVVRHVKTKDGIKQYRYPVNLVGRPGNEWDVVVKTPYGQRNLFLVAPHVGVTTYQPNKAEIIKKFKERKHGWFS